MTIDPQSPDVDPADLAEQQQDLTPPVVDDEVPVREPADLPLEADEADVAEQRSELPDWDDDER
ncbi:MAG: hypothetical protein JWO76_955 [Nocardioides sp.]|jgi:hypothetical protein|nr:hypothetical protein [Nocardioides sp.]